MKTTIDRAGRIVVPKALRDALSLTAGQELELDAPANGTLEIQPPRAALRLVPDGDRVRVVADEPLPPITADMIRDTLEQIRR